jgi:hypothetical protein
MANVKTYNLSIYLNCGRDLTFRNISRVAADRYIKHHVEFGNVRSYFLEQR